MSNEIAGNIMPSTKIEGGKYPKNQEKTYELNGLERFGGIYSKISDFYQGNCNKNDLKDELELMLIIANRMLKIPELLMNYINELNYTIGPYHWEEKITSKIIGYNLKFPNDDNTTMND